MPDEGLRSQFIFTFPDNGSTETSVSCGDSGTVHIICDKLISVSERKKNRIIYLTIFFNIDSFKTVRDKLK
jgi:hypothetical protein